MNIEFLQTYAANWMGESATPEEAEREIVQTIERIAGKLAWDFRFGSITYEDAKQEGVLFGLQAIERGSYDVARPLANFMAVHIKNRLHNFKRNLFMRPERPCDCCDAFGLPENPCRKWLKWNRNNVAKQALGKAGGDPLGHDQKDREPEPVDSFIAEVEGFALNSLPQKLRSDYLRLKAGVALPADRREAVFGAIRARFAEEARDGF